MPDLVTLTTAAEQYEPSGDPDHVAYGSDYLWTCTCGASSRFFATRTKQLARAKQHSRYCDGETEVDVHL